MGMHRLMCRNLHTWRASAQSPRLQDVCPECGRVATVIVKGVHYGSLDGEIPNELERKAMDAYVRRQDAT